MAKMERNIGPEILEGRRAPSGAARTLLLIAAKNPRALTEVA